MHEIDTDRLSMRQVVEADRKNFYRLLREPEVIKYCFDAPDAKEVSAMFNARLPRWNVNSIHWLCLAIFEKNSHQFIGLTGFKPMEENAEIGYLLQPNYFGKGYATESLLALVKYACAMGIHSLIANITQSNFASIRVVEKCGFQFLTKSLDAVSIGGKMHNNLQYINSCNS